MNLVRASLVVKRQSTLTPKLLRGAAPVETSCCKRPRSGVRRFKHCRLQRLNSISAMFNQLPCEEVGIREMDIDHILDEIRPIRLGAMFRHLYRPPTLQRAKDKNELPIPYRSYSAS